MRLLAIVALAWVLAACDSGEERAAGRPEPTPAAEEIAPEASASPGSEPTAPTPPTTALHAPDTAATARTAEGARGDAARGEVTYQQYCASCHGPRGDGNGPLAASLDPKPARHSDAATMNALSDDYLFGVVKEGGASVGKSPLMAPWGGTLSDEQIWDLVAFMRSLTRTPDQP